MNLLPKQYDQLSDIFKEAGAVVLGGLIIGTVLSDNPSYALVAVGIVVYITCVLSALYVKKLGE